MKHFGVLNPARCPEKSPRKILPWKFPPGNIPLGIVPPWGLGLGLELWVRGRNHSNPNSSNPNPSNLNSSNPNPRGDFS